MMDYKIHVSKEGDQFLEGLEKSEDCYRLGEIARQAGKVTSEKEKDHPPVYQTLHQRSE